MPCSCKVKRQVQYRDPVDKQTRVLSVQQPSDSTSNKELSPKAYTGLDVLLDTSSTTKPDQLCLNCVRKHLGLAYKFLQCKDVHHFLAAIGELLCAVQHLKGSFPHLAAFIKDKAVLWLRKPNNQVQQGVSQLIQQLQADPAQDLPQYIPLPSFPQEQELLAILLVQSLLFIQLTYQEVNKTWATAELSFFSYNAFRTTNALKYYETYRPLWKLIQSMHFMDENYLAARDYIHSLLVSKYPVYQQILIPQKKEQFEEDYKKQKELMQKIQEQKSLPHAT